MLMTITSNWQKIGALCFVIGGLQFLLAEKISALAWMQPVYSYASNYISDLGIPLCGLQSDGRFFCSPLYWVMNSGFIIEAVLFFLACLLLRNYFSGWAKILFLGFGFLHAIGGITIGIFPSFPEPALWGTFSVHRFGAALTIIGGNLCILTTGVAALHKNNTQTFIGLFAGLSIVLGCIGILNVLILTLDVVPVGLIERGSVYTITLWQIITGLGILLFCKLKNA